jgi:transposase-like protein
MVRPRKYPEELRQRAIRLALDARRSPVTWRGACQRIGDQLGINPDTLRGWVHEVEVDAGPAGGDHDGRCAAVGLARAGGQGLAAHQRDPAVGVGFLRGGARPPTDQVVA